MNNDDVHEIALTVNGRTVERSVPARRLLVHFLRDDLGIRGPKVGCDSGHCGACTVNLNGKTVKSCMMLACQADGAEIRTAESLADESGELNALQSSFREHHALQCGYCTSGMLMSAEQLMERNQDPSRDEIRSGIKGNVCRCTGYVNIVEAIEAMGGEAVTS
jgi:aerobic carbon-monoxide dehydrogenase small subunit